MNPRRTVRPYRPPVGASHDPQGNAPQRPALPAPAVETTGRSNDPPSKRRPPGARQVTVGTKLDADGLAKLDRLCRRAGGLVSATRSATIRWLIETADD